MNIKRKIDYFIIWKVLNSIATEKEQGEFQKWLNDSSHNKDYFDTLKKNYQKNELHVSPEEVEEELNHLLSSIHKDQKPSKFSWYKVAAAVMVPILLGISIYYYFNNMNHTSSSDQQFAYDSEVTLTLNNGQTIVLGDNNNSELVIDQIVSGADSLQSQLTSPEDDDEQDIQYHTIHVPRGANYKMQMADGTVVWLNSDTELRFPASFNGNVRNVFLTGEALFEVSKNKKKAFIVHTGLSEIKVYGTVFNVMSYPEDKVEATTLVEGSVSVTKDGNEYMIEPGEQSSIDKVSNTLNINKVDVDLYTSWKDGIYRFENVTLDELATKLQRMYDVKFIFMDENSKTEFFTGALRQETDYAFFLQLIEESSNVKVEFSGNEIYIRSKQ